MRRIVLFIPMLVTLCSCHTKKDISNSAVQGTSNWTHSVNIDSAFFAWAIELGSFTLTAEPVQNSFPCGDTTSTATQGYRYHLSANSATIKGENKEVTRSISDSHEQDSTVIRESVAQDTTTIATPTSTGGLLFMIACIFVFIIVVKAKV